jgi:polyisoprenoid-binding protein YceI
MKMLISAALISAAGLLAGFAPREEVRVPVADAFGVDGVHSSVMFRVKHQNVAFFYGRFNTVSGSFNLDEANPAASSVEITIDTESIDSANEGRDKHLKSPDFFSTKEFPTMTFKSTSVESKGEKKYLVKGDLTLKGVTKAIEVTIEDTGRGAGRGGAKIAGIESVFTIKRSDYGMNYMVGPLSDDVTIYVGLEGKM